MGRGGRRLVDEDHPDRERIVLAPDSLNTHHSSSLYEAFDPVEVRRIAERLVVHYTPEARQLAQPCPEAAEGMAEIELAVLARQCAG